MLSFAKARSESSIASSCRLSSEEPCPLYSEIAQLSNDGDDSEVLSIGGDSFQQIFAVASIKKEASLL